MKTIHWLLLWLIGVVPILRRHYLASLRWSLSADQGEVIFNKPIPPNCGGSFGYSRRIKSGNTVAMTVWVSGQRIESSQVSRVAVIE